MSGLAKKLGKTLTVYAASALCVLGVAGADMAYHHGHQHRDVLRVQRANHFWEMVAGDAKVDHSPEGDLLRGLKLLNGPTTNSDRAEINRRLEMVVFSVKRYPHVTDRLNQAVFKGDNHDAAGWHSDDGGNLSDYFIGQFALVATGAKDVIEKPVPKYTAPALKFAWHPWLYLWGGLLLLLRVPFDLYAVWQLRRRAKKDPRFAMLQQAKQLQRKILQRYGYSDNDRDIAKIERANNLVADLQRPIPSGVRLTVALSPDEQMDRDLDDLEHFARSHIEALDEMKRMIEPPLANSKLQPKRQQ